MATEKRLIDANRLRAIFNPDVMKRFNSEVIQMAIDDAPTVDAVEVVHGRWEPYPDVKGYERCSVCHDCIIYDDWATEPKWYYCPNCGAKMRGSEE